MTAPLEMVALTTLQIYLMIYLIYILQVSTKNVIKLAKKLSFCANCLVVKHMKGRSKFLGLSKHAILIKTDQTVHE